MSIAGGRTSYIGHMIDVSSGSRLILVSIAFSGPVTQLPASSDNLHVVTTRTTRLHGATRR
jgi:hypothetical protein